MTNRLSRDGYNLDIELIGVQDIYGKAVPGARIGIQGPNAYATFNLPLAFMAVMAREFYDVCAIPSPPTPTAPVPSQPPEPRPLSDEAMAWAYRASQVHRELANYNISCRALRSRISGLRFAAFENTYGIKAEAIDGGLLSSWWVEAGEGNHAGGAPSFETAAIACGERILELLEARAKQTEAALGSEKT